MAEAATLPQVLEAYTNADWSEEPFQFLVNGTPLDFTGASAKLGLRLPAQAMNAVEFTSDNNELTITTPNWISITAPLATMSALAPGLYNFDLVVTFSSGLVQTLLAGQALIIGGIS